MERASRSGDSHVPWGNCSSPQNRLPQPGWSILPRMPRPGEPHRCRTGPEAGKASGHMEQAAKAAQRGQRPQARQQGEEASRSLAPLSDQLQRQRQEMQREWRRQVVEAIDQALSETSRLAERQLRVQEQLRERGDPGAATRAEQAAIEEGVQKLLEQVRQAGGKNALVPPQIGAALGAAQMRMQQAREAISSAAPNTRKRRPGRRAVVGSTRRRISFAGQRRRLRSQSGPGWRRPGAARATRSTAGRARAAGRRHAADGWERSNSGTAPTAGGQAARSCSGAGEAAGRGKHSRSRRHGRRGGPAVPLEGGRLERRTSRGSSGCSAACSMPEERSRAGSRTRRRNGRALRPPAIASIFLRRCGLDWRMRIGGCGCRHGRSSSSSLRRNAGWW